MKRKMYVLGTLLLLCLLMFGCSVKGAVESMIATKPTIAPTPIPTSAPTPTPTPMPSSWETDNYLDDFGDKTGSIYLRGEFKGKWSNSYTSDSVLTVYFFYDTDYSSIRLIKHHSYTSPSTASFSILDSVEIKVKIDDKEFSITPIIIRDDDDLHISNDDDGFRAVKNALLNGKEIRFVIKGGLLGDVYKFTIDGIGFKETLEQSGLH